MPSARKASHVPEPGGGRLRDSRGLAVLTKEAFRCTLIATGLDKNIDYVSVLVNRAPEILSLALDSHKEFVQVPSLTQAALSSLECQGVLGA